MTVTSLPNPNSGIDAVTLRDGRHLLVYNHMTDAGHPQRGRDKLNIAVSDDGENWSAVIELKEDVETFEYPAVIQADDDLVHITCSFSLKQIKHLVLDPAELQGDGD